MVPVLFFMDNRFLPTYIPDSTRVLRLCITLSHAYVHAIHSYSRFVLAS
jgi:hypothetical protein